MDMDLLNIGQLDSTTLAAICAAVVKSKMKSFENKLIAFWFPAQLNQPKPFGRYYQSKSIGKCILDLKYKIRSNNQYAQKKSHTNNNHRMTTK